MPAQPAHAHVQQPSMTRVLGGHGQAMPAYGVLYQWHPTETEAQSLSSI